MTPTCVVYSLALRASTNSETLRALSSVIAQPPAYHTLKSANSPPLFVHLNLSLDLKSLRALI
jgi:hypothetical protein